MSDYSHSRAEHYRMNYIGESQGHETGNLKPLSQSHSLPDQSQIMALTAEWGHSVFEHSIVRSHGRHIPDIPYKLPIYESQNIGGMIHNTEEPTYLRPPGYMYKQELHVNNSGHQNSHADSSGHQESHASNSGTPYSPQGEPKKEEEDSTCVVLTPPKKDELQSERQPEKDEKEYSPESPKFRKYCPEIEIESPSPVQSIGSPKCNSPDWKGAKLSDDEISAKRAAQALAQREVRRRRREKMTEEEKIAELAALAAAQRESRRRQRERMTEEELQIRKTLCAITQREIRRRRMSKMSEEELKAYRAREALRQKELRLRKRSAMTEEELKIIKAKEAAASAERRARRLGKELKTPRLKIDNLDPSPS